MGIGVDSAGPPHQQKRQITAVDAAVTIDIPNRAGVTEGPVRNGDRLIDLVIRTQCDAFFDREKNARESWKTGSPGSDEKSEIRAVHLSIAVDVTETGVCLFKHQIRRT